MRGPISRGVEPSHPSAWCMRYMHGSARTTVTHHAHTTRQAYYVCMFKILRSSLFYVQCLPLHSRGLASWLVDRFTRLQCRYCRRDRQITQCRHPGIQLEFSQWQTLVGSTSRP
jgi:hypothetical protein